jgi:hypothetical protein
MTPSFRASSPYNQQMNNMYNNQPMNNMNNMYNNQQMNNMNNMYNNQPNNNMYNNQPNDNMNNMNNNINNNIQPYNNFERLNTLSNVISPLAQPLQY